MIEAVTEANVSAPTGVNFKFRAGKVASKKTHHEVLNSIPATDQGQKEPGKVAGIRRLAMEDGGITFIVQISISYKNY